jgi:hypothetical protein
VLKVLLKVKDGGGATTGGWSVPAARAVGTWSMEGHLVGSGEITVRGETTFRWLPGGFFLEQHATLNFLGMQIESQELIGYDPETDTFPSTVFSNVSPTPLPYRWEVEDETLKISVSYGPLDAAFTGTFEEDGDGFHDGWRPNPGADETINVPMTSAGAARDRCRAT